MRYAPSKTKMILVLLDGLGDRAYPELDNQTPLQAADTANLDRLAALGCSGLYHASVPGQCLPSEVAHYRLLGYKTPDFPGRGLLEAVGENVPFEDDDVLCLAHLARVIPREHGWILDAGRDDLDASPSELVRRYGTIDHFEESDIRLRLHQIGRNDAVLVLHGAVSPYISDSDPIRTGLPIGRVVPLAPNPETENALRTARFLHRYLLFCHRRLSDLPSNLQDRLPAANFLVTQRCGRRKFAPSFQQRWGLRGMLLASGGMYIGLARELGMDARRFADGPDPGEDLRQRVDAALSDDLHDFFHVHTKAPDHAAHSGSPEAKRDVICVLDRGLESLVAALRSRSDLLVAVCADHSTPCGGGLIHSGEPVPVVFCGRGVRRDRVGMFNEIDASGGALGHLRGAELLHMLLNYADRSAFYSHRLGPEATDYFPSFYPRFTDESY